MDHTVVQELKLNMKMFIKILFIKAQIVHQVVSEHILLPLEYCSAIKTNDISNSTISSSSIVSENTSGQHSAS
jgi:hypothetical protein